MTSWRLHREAMVKGYTLEELLKHAANKEGIDRQAKLIEQSLRLNQNDNKEVNRVKEKKPPYSKQRKNPSQWGQNEQHCRQAGKVCSCWGLNHESRRSLCPAVEKKCYNCSRSGHFARMCRAPKKQGKSQQRQRSELGNKVKYLSENNTRRREDNEDDSSNSDFVFKTEALVSGLPTVQVQINGIKGQAEVDSCSTANIIDEERFDLLQNALKEKLKLKPATTKLYAYGQSKPIPLIGSFEAEVESVGTGNRTMACFLVAKGRTKSRPLLSLDTSVKLGVLTITNSTRAHETESIPASPNSNSMRNQSNLPIRKGINCPTIQHLLNTYNDVFTGLGKHKRVKAKLIVDESVTPIVHKQRRIPYNLRRKAKEEEQRLEKVGIIENVPDNQPTTWCTNPVIASKPHNPDAIRYCSDIRVPNTAIKRPVKEVLTTSDIKFKLEGCKIFSILDMNKGYHQIELDEESRHLTTFHGTQQKMRYARLNYGTISSQDIFDKVMDDTVEGLNGVLHIRDDFIVYGTSETEHDEALESLLKRFRECGLTFNPKKCKFRLPEEEFLDLFSLARESNHHQPKFKH